MKEIKWYMWIWIWVLPTKSITDISKKKGLELVTTMYFKEYKDTFYVVSEKFNLITPQGKADRRVRRKNGN